MPFISIIVPVFKSEKYIHRCIDSILAQTFKNIELILVDDGSPDNCGQICDLYSEKYNLIRVIHQENLGVSAARNAGIEIAKGNWILFIDSDDFIDPEYISSIVQNAKTRTLTIQGYKAIFSNSHVMIKSLKERTYDKTNIHDLFTNPLFFEYGHPFGKLYETQIILKNKLRFNEELSYAEDLIFLLSYIYIIDTIKIIEGAFYNYTVNSSTSLSNKIYPFKNEYLLFNEFSRLNVDIALKNNFKPTNESFHYAAVLLVRTIFSIYKYNNLNYRARIRLLKQLDSHRSVLRKYYAPQIIFLKIVRILFLNNIYILDIFCRLKFYKIGFL